MLVLVKFSPGQVLDGQDVGVGRLEGVEHRLLYDGLLGSCVLLRHACSKDTKGVSLRVIRKQDTYSLLYKDFIAGRTRLSIIVKRISIIVKKKKKKKKCLSIIA